MIMNKKNIFDSAVLKTIILIIFIGLSTILFPINTYARPVPRTEKGGREDTIPGGTRGDCLYEDQKPLTALIPKTNKTQELTLAAHPTIFIYVPENTANAADFVLLDSNHKKVYETRLLLPETSGIIDITISPDAPELQIGLNYHWKFALVCQSVNPKTLVKGSIQRINPTPDLTKNLQQSQESEHWLIYSQAGIWYETLVTLAEQVRSYPNDTEITSQWTTLLNSVGLNNVATEPLKQLLKE